MEQGLGLGNSAMQKGIGIEKEKLHNVDCQDKQSSIYRDRSQRPRGSVDCETMTNADYCAGDMPFPTQSTGSEYSAFEESVKNGMNNGSQHADGDGSNKTKVSGVFNLFKQSFKWIQQQKTVFMALIAAALHARDIMIPRVHHTWAIASVGLLYFGRLSLLLSILWLDCSLRGLDSLLRLGTTSFFVVIWCSVLSIIAMAGFFNVLMTLGVVCVAAFVFGYAAAIFMTAVFGTVVLWLYGSFWVTGLLIMIGGIIFALNHERLALLIMTLYSIYCAKVHVGWFGMIQCMNLAFISSDILIYFLKSNINQDKGKGSGEQTGTTNGGAGNFSYGHSGSYGKGATFSSGRTFGESSQTSHFAESHGRASTSRLAEADPIFAEEVIRLLDSPDHYAVLGLSRYENIDVAVLKREYRKKAILVHPDKNMGNVNAEEAFKKLQNAYEVLLDSVKKKIYDEELRREELASCFHRFRNHSRRTGKHQPFKYGYANYENEGGDSPADSRRIACKKCNGSHIWILTDRTKARARWCQVCQDYHQAKDGDGWVEQTVRTVLFGMLKKEDAPRAYACAESKIYNVTEWVLCQGMKCAPNTHKPTFHVSTTIIGKSSVRGGSSTRKAGANGDIPTEMDENMTQKEYFEWLQNAMASGMFDSSSGVSESSAMKTGNHAKNNRKKRKGKKEW